jgi:hypothetical protein
MSFWNASRSLDPAGFSKFITILKSWDIRLYNSTAPELELINRQKHLSANNGSQRKSCFDYSYCGISFTHGWGSVCKFFLTPAPLGQKYGHFKIWPKLDFFQIAPVWPKIGFWSTPNIFHARLVWENTLDTKKWDFVFKKMSICCVWRFRKCQ